MRFSILYLCLVMGVSVLPLMSEILSSGEDSVDMRNDLGDAFGDYSIFNLVEAKGNKAFQVIYSTGVEEGLPRTSVHIARTNEFGWKLDTYKKFLGRVAEVKVVERNSRTILIFQLRSRMEEKSIEIDIGGAEALEVVYPEGRE